MMRMLASAVVGLCLLVGCGETSPGPGGPDGGGAGGTASNSGGRAGQVGGSNAGGINGGGSGAGGLGSGGSALATGGTASGSIDGGLVTVRSNQLDLLFMIDNSSSMADKQAVLEASVPQLVQRLVNPNCLRADGSVGDPAASPESACPAGETREFSPITDMHVGIVTSSLGGHGSTSCLGSDTSGKVTDQEANDHAWLVGSRPRYQNPPGGEVVDPSQGFLNWHPAIGQAAASLGPFDTTLAAMVVATDDQGCGYESQLESWYRFLVDPAPYQSISVESCGGGGGSKCATPSGIDQTLLAQRAAFLRPDSLLAVVMLTDENDCSIIEGGQYYLIAMPPSAGTMPPGTPECDANPNDPCCHNCNSGTPAGCPDETQACQVREQGWAAQDSANLRCWDEKRRYGIDFLYPTQRYVNALTQPQICPAHADLSLAGCSASGIVDNPIYAGGSGHRDRSLVYLGGILGVPWQDIASKVDGNGVPYADSDLHYQTAAQMKANGTWNVILGNQSPSGTAAPTQPTDILMQESSAVRSGTDAQGDPIVPPTNAPAPGQPGSNPINGHEWNAAQNTDLQYACIFQLATPRDCLAESQAPTTSVHRCDCLAAQASEANPICQGAGEDPNNPTDANAYGQTQIYAKAYPGLRELQVLHDFGDDSFVASICARNLAGPPTTQDFGYNPAFDALVNRLKSGVAASPISD